MANYTDVKPGTVDFDKLQREVAVKMTPKRKVDAPPRRLTVSTFVSDTGIIDWVMRGDLTKAIDNFNSGGVYSQTTGISLPKDFWLMRIFDTMEELGKAKFEQFAPGVWDSALAVYYSTFDTKIVSTHRK